MNVVVPVNFTDNYFTANNIVELWPAWVSNKYPAYSVGDVVYFDGAYGSNIHRLYKRRVAGSGTDAPNLDIANWQDIGPNNKWAAMDASNSTQSVMDGGVIQWEFAPSTLSFVPTILTLGMFGLVGNALWVRSRLHVGGTAYSYDTAILGVDSNPAQAVISDIVVPAGGYLCVQLNSDDGQSSAFPLPAKCGTIVVGQSIFLGKTLLKPSIGIISYSSKSTDSFGVTTFIKGVNSKRVTVKVLIDNSELDTVYRTLAMLEATPCVWQVSDIPNLKTLNVFGFFKDFSIDVEYVKNSLCSIEIEGLA